MLDIRSVAAALPTVKTLPECANFSKTVAPFLPQLYDFPSQIYARAGDLQALKHLYITTNPLISALAFALFVSVVVLVVSEVNRNYSQVDRIWSILPVIYNCHYALWANLAGLPTERLNHVMAVTILWGARLTFNYWRKGGYSIGSEDYRWETVKKNIGPVGMFVFNIVFISLAQNILLYMITAPTYILLLCSTLTGDGLSTYDHVFSKLIFVLVLVEFFADQQQWDFHRAKEQYRSTAKVPKEHKFTREQLDRGFNTSGLWAYSRHPNFAAEQGVWMCLYQWCCCESMTYMNYCFAGAISYLILFQGSTWLTESLSASKYSEYKVYQQRVGKFLPKRNTQGMDATKTGGASEESKGVATGSKVGATTKRR